MYRAGTSCETSVLIGISGFGSSRTARIPGSPKVKQLRCRKSRWVGGFGSSRHEFDGHHAVPIEDRVSPVSGYRDKSQYVRAGPRLELGQHPWDIPSLWLVEDDLDEAPRPPRSEEHT